MNTNFGKYKTGKGIMISSLILEISGLLSKLNFYIHDNYINGVSNSISFSNIYSANMKINPGSLKSNSESDRENLFINFNTVNKQRFYIERIADFQKDGDTRYNICDFNSYFFILN